MAHFLLAIEDVSSCIYVNRFHPHKKSFNFETHIVLLVLVKEDSRSTNSTVRRIFHQFEKVRFRFGRQAGMFESWQLNFFCLFF